MWFVQLLFCVSLLWFCAFLIWAIHIKNESYYYDKNVKYHRRRNSDDGTVPLWLAIIGSVILFGTIGGFLVGEFGAVAFGGIVCGPGISVGLFYAITGIVKNARFKKASKIYQQNNEYDDRTDQQINDYSDTSYETDMFYKKAVSFFNLKMNFDENELKENFRNIMKTYHPDKFNNAEPEVKKLVEDKAKEANEMYEYLLSRLNTRR